VKKPLPCEEKPLYKMAKKLVAARPLPAGHVLTLRDVAIKSPNDGLPPYELDNVIGKVTARDLAEDESIAWDALESRRR
jgi:N-acetylneuraminate synthase/sialic acid synthase